MCWCIGACVCVCVPEGEFVKKICSMDSLSVCLWQQTHRQTGGWAAAPSPAPARLRLRQRQNQMKAILAWNAERANQKKFKAGDMIWNYLSTPFSTTFPTFHFALVLGFPFPFSLAPHFGYCGRRQRDGGLSVQEERGEQGRAGQGMVKVVSPLSLHLVLAQCCFSFGFNWSSFSMELHAKRRRHAMTDIDSDVGIVELQRGKSCDCIQMFY